MSVELNEYEGQLNTFLKNIFQQHGVECKEESQVLLFPKERMIAYAKIFDMSTLPTKLLQLDVVLKIGPGKEIVESCVGIGMNINAAIEDAWKNFLKNTFHVLLATFFIPEDKELVNRLEWIVNGREYDVTMGQMAFRGNLPKSLSLKWYEEFESMIKEQELSVGTHWIRLFYAQSGNEMISCEILLDNNVWKSVENRVKTFNFPKSNDYLSLRIFMIMQDGLKISRIAGILAWMGNEESDVIIKELEKTGMSTIDAEKVQILMPLAFGRVFLRSMTTASFSDEAVITNDNNEEISIKLNNELIYTEAYKLAEEIMANGQIDKKHLETILLQSSEFNAYNNALHEGAEPEDLNKSSFSSPRIYLPSYVSGIITDNEIENEEEAKKSPWRFWNKKK
ncbi:MAG: DUF6348 family protein [Dysgonomonas sp.]